MGVSLFWSFPGSSEPSQPRTVRPKCSRNERPSRAAQRQARRIRIPGLLQVLQRQAFADGAAGCSVQKEWLQALASLASVHKFWR